MSKTIDSIPEINPFREKIFTVDESTRLSDAYRLMRKNGVHHLLILRENMLVGMVSDREIFEKGIQLEGESLAPNLAVRDIMIHDLPILTNESTLDDAMGFMTHYKCSGLPIMIAGKIVGVLTHTDLLHYLRKSMDRTEEAKPGVAQSLADKAKMLATNPIHIRLTELVEDIGM